MYLRTSLLHRSLSKSYSGYVTCINATASAARNSLLASNTNTELVYPVEVTAVLVPASVGSDPVEFM